ncbi:NAD(P)-dependent oxidoreductase [Falsirhodobacter xinxiangensis]|uniref:NAD(P)-dependent oxidoreductase n=1 Tax=Falsirhodobacter xinxiangensis TaxID=2530049 RepID=UPI0010AA8C72|nr:NAD(P)-dependent oxidoreductase [Rhodobacter xinxiangensis]
MTRLFLSHGTTARTYWYGEKALAGLRALGEVVINPVDTELEGKHLTQVAQGCQIMVLDRSTRVGAEEIAALPDLVAILRSGVETRYVDVDAASAAGVLVTRSNPGYIASTAELVLAHMLNAARNVPDYVAAYRTGDVRQPSQGREMSGRVAGLIGYGRIARNLARILDAMGMTVLANDPYGPIEAPAVATNMDDLLRRSDFVIPLLAASEETRNLVGAGAFALMKQDAWLVNCSRGDVVDEVALRQALDARAISGAAMDVGWAADNTPSPELALRPDVQATPHIGNLTIEASSRHPMDTVEQASQILRGNIPFGALNAGSASRISRLSPANTN